MRDALVHEHDPAGVGEETARQVDRVDDRRLARREGGDVGGQGDELLLPRPYHGDDSRPRREPIPIGEDEVVRHRTGGDDDVELPIGVLLDEPAGGTLRIGRRPAEADEVEVFDEDVVPHSLRPGQSHTNPLHDLHEGRPRRPLLIDDENPLDGDRISRDRCRRAILRRRGDGGRLRGNNHPGDPPHQCHEGPEEESGHALMKSPPLAGQGLEQRRLFAGREGHGDARRGGKLGTTP